RLVSAVIAAAVEVGVPAQRVQTDHVQIEPRYEEQRTRRDFVGYFVRKTIVITLREPERFDALLGQVLEAGANYVHGIQFRTTDLRNQRDYARKLAIHAAREKAEDLATELDQRIGLPLSITEESGGAWYWYNDTWGGRWGGGWMSQNVVQSVGGGPSSIDEGFALGEISVTARIRATFELE
ncbi:MAG: SIMPL domain-containing protein, partial [Candidatus Eisenbacteria bacterium]